MLLLFDATVAEESDEETEDELTFTVTEGALKFARYTVSLDSVCMCVRANPKSVPKTKNSGRSERKIGVKSTS